MIFTVLMLICFGILFYFLKKKRGRKKKYYNYTDEKIKEINNLSMSTDADPKKYEKVPN